MSLAEFTKKSAKVHSITELLNSLSSAAKKATSEKIPVYREERNAEKETKKQELDLMQKKAE